MQKEMMINCFSYVHGKKNAFDLAKVLNKLKSNSSKLFSVCSISPGIYCVMGEVTRRDWIFLDLSSDFMEI